MDQQRSAIVIRLIKMFLLSDRQLLTVNNDQSLSVP